MVQTQFGFQSGTNNLMGGGTNQFGNFTTKQPSVSNTKTTTNSKFPGLDKKYIDEIEERTKNIANYADKMQIQEAMYDDFYAKQVEEEKQAQRTEYKNTKKQDAVNTDNKTQKQMDNVAVRSADLADLIRKKYNISLSAGTDDEVINLFVSQIDNGEQLMTDYLNGKNDKLLKKGGLVKSETFWQKLGDFGVGFMQSPGKFGYNIIGQWIDKAAKSMADKLEGSDLQKRVTEKAVEMFGEDEVNAYVEQRNRELENGTAFNGREATDIRTPILGEERANSKATKAGEVVGDIASSIALTAPLASAMAPAYAASTIPQALAMGAAEGAIGTTVSSVGTSGELPTEKELAIGMGLGAAGGALSRYLAKPKISTDKELKKEAEQYIQKSIKPTVKGKQNAKDFDKFIDDTMDSVDAMVKNKGVLQYTDDAGNVVKGELPKNMREFSEAIDSMKRYVYQEYDDIAKQAGDAGAKVNLNKLYQQLDDMADDISANMANPGWRKTVEQYKDILLQYTDDAGNISMDQATKLTQEYNSLLKAFFKNPNMNDVSKNAIIAQMNKGVRSAINDGIDDALGNAIKGGSKASTQYSELKQLYGKLLSIEDEVSKRALVLARNNSKGLSQTMIDSLSAGDIAEALLTMDVGKIAKGTTMKLIGNIYQNLNSPDRNLQQLFKLIENPNSTSLIREGVEAVAPYAAEGGIGLMEGIEAQK